MLVIKTAWPVKAKMSYVLHRVRRMTEKKQTQANRAQIPLDSWHWAGIMWLSLAELQPFDSQEVQHVTEYDPGPNNKCIACFGLHGARMRAMP